MNEMKKFGTNRSFLEISNRGPSKLTLPIAFLCPFQMLIYHGPKMRYI